MTATLVEAPADLVPQADSTTRPTVHRWALGAVIALGCAIRAFPDLRAGGLTGVLEYDDGVHYAAGLALLHGQVPYRDFVLLHPPLIAALMAPFAALGEFVGQPYAMACARLAVIGIAGVNIGLLARLVRRHSGTAALIAAFCYACFPGAIVAERTVLLEPIVNLLCLLALDALDRRRGTRAGVLLAVACCVKLFAVVYPLAVVAVALTGRGVRPLRPVALAFVTTLGAVAGPFVLLAPGAFVHDVLIVQATRPASGAEAPLTRLSDMLGVTSLLGHPAGAPAVAAAGVLLLAAGVVARLPGQLTWPLIWIGTVTAFCVSSSYFSHYAGFLAPTVSALIGLGVTAGRPRLTSLAAVTAVSVLSLEAARSFPGGADRPGPAVAARRFTSPRMCGYSDAPGLLVAADRLRVSTGRCPSWVDPRGAATAHVPPDERANFRHDGFRRLPRWQEQATDDIHHADFLLVSGSVNDSPDYAPTTRSVIRTSFRRRAVGGGTHPWELWVRDRPDG